MYAQIGGKTAADGIFTLDDVEDLDLVASGVERNWIATYVWGGGLSAQALAETNLTLAPGQSPIGAIYYDLPVEYGYIDKSFGVPVPAVAGASTLTDPGNITEFETLDFLISFTPTLTNQQFWVILETYPETSPDTYPRLMWRYEPVAGNSFQRVSIPLDTPTLKHDSEGHTVEELLAQTRYLAFYFYAEHTGFPPPRMRVYVDDITLVPREMPPASPNVWIISGKVSPETTEEDNAG